MASNQSLAEIIRQLREALLSEKPPLVVMGQAFISGALTGGMVPHQNYPAPELEEDPAAWSSTQCDAWADTAEAMNDNANWDNYAEPGEGGGN